MEAVLALWCKLEPLMLLTFKVNRGEGYVRSLGHLARCLVNFLDFGIIDGSSVEYFRRRRIQRSNLGPNLR